MPVDPEQLTFAALELAAARGSSARGPAEIFDKLFKTPFGLRALSKYRAQLEHTTAAVFGVSRETSERMGLLLDQIAAAEHGPRIASVVGSFAVSAFYGLYGGSMLALDRRFSFVGRGGADLIGGVSLGLGAASLGLGIYRMLSLRDGEQLALDYHVALDANGGDYARAFALANDRLRAVANAEARQRWLEGIAGGFLIAGSGLALTLTELDAHTPDARINARALAGAGVLLGTVVLCKALLMELPIQRLLTVWDSDTRSLQLQPVVAPLAGGAYLGVDGRF